MRVILSFFVLTLCSVAPLHANDCCKQANIGISQRIREIDINILLKNYETIQTEIAKMKMQHALGSSEVFQSDQERDEALARRAFKLQVYNSLREDCLKQLEEIKKASVASK